MSAGVTVTQADRQLFKAIGAEEGWDCTERDIDGELWDADGSMQVIAQHRAAGQAELASEVERLHSLAKANNDLARRYAAEIQSLRGAAVLALELIEDIEDEQGFSSSTAVPAQALRTALSRLSGEVGK